MAAFQIKKGKKIYRVKAFSSVTKLAERGLLDAHDPIFVPSLNRWVYAGSIKELKPLLGSPSKTGEPMVGPAKAQTDDSIELPMAYVEALAEEELPPPPPALSARPVHRRPTRRQAPLPEFDPGPLSALGNYTADDAPDALASTAESNPLSRLGNAPGAPHQRRSGGDGGFTFEPIGPSIPGRPAMASGDVTYSSGSSLNIGRILLFAVVPAFLLLFVYLSVRSAATEEFPEPEPREGVQLAPVAVDGAASAAEPVVYGLPTPEDPLRELELTLRGKVPLSLRNPVRSQEQVQDDIFAELLNGGAFPQSVSVDPLVGEIPPHAALRSLEVRVVVQARETSRMDTRDQVALATLIVGKYQRFGGLRISEVEVNIRDADAYPVATYVFSGVQARDFYAQEVSLVTFFDWMES